MITLTFSDLGCEVGRLQVAREPFVPSCGPQFGAMRPAIRSLGRKANSGTASSRGTWVVLASGSGGGGRLTPEQHKHAFSVLSNTRLLDWKQWGSSLGGTLIVDDASHKEDVQRVGDTRRGRGLLRTWRAGSPAARVRRECRLISSPWLDAHVIPQLHLSAGSTGGHPELRLFRRCAPLLQSPGERVACHCHRTCSTPKAGHLGGSGSIRASALLPCCRRLPLPVLHWLRGGADGCRHSHGCAAGSVEAHHLLSLH